MKTIRKRVLSLLLALLLVGGVAPLGALADMPRPTLPVGAAASWRQNVRTGACRLGSLLRGLSLRASAESYAGTCGDGVTWSFDSETGVLSVTGTGTMDQVPWSSHTQKIRSVVIGSGVQNIGERAFYLCSALTDVTIPDSVTDIGSFAFDGCTALKFLTIPDSVREIGTYAFRDCRSLTGIHIPDGVTVISACAFYGCAKLASLTIPDGVTIIGSYAFYGCVKLASLTIPGNVTAIGGSAFYGCAALQSLTIPSGVRVIEPSLCYGCTALESVTIPDNVTAIGNNAFYGCAALQSVTIPDNVTAIGSSAFYGCAALGSVTIPDSVVTLGSSAFYGCTSLTNVTLGTGINEIPDSAFNGCAALSAITIPGNVVTIGTNAFRACTSLSTAVMENGVETIGNSAFYDCEALTEVTIPESVKTICDQAFKGSTGITTLHFNAIRCFAQGTKSFVNNTTLTSVTFGDKVESIPDYAFSQCAGITEITLPDSLTYIGINAFFKCAGITELTIPENVTSIDDWAFQSTGLSVLHYNAVNCTVNGTYSPFGSDDLQTLVIGSKVESISDYMFYSCEYVKEIVLPDSLKSIGSRAFYGCRALTEITIPDSVETIGSLAFSWCVKLKNVTVGKGVKSIGEDVFSYCGSLQEMTLPFIGRAPNASGKTAVLGVLFGEASRNVRQYYWPENKYESRYYAIPPTLRSVTLTNCTTIPCCAFQNCSMLKRITIPDTVTAIESYAFAGCTALTEYTIPESVTRIGEGVFQDCTGLTRLAFNAVRCTYSGTSSGTAIVSGCTALQTVDFGSTVEMLPERLLFDGTELCTLTIPDSVTDIGAYAFGNCAQLSDIRLSDNITHLGENAFFATALYADPDNWTDDGVLYLGRCLIDTDGTLSGAYAVREGTVCIADNALQNCDALTSLMIPASVLGMDVGMFLSCEALTAFRAAEDNPAYATDGAGVLFNKDKSVLLRCPVCFAVTDYTAPDTVREIADGAFQNCTHLQSIAMPDSVTRIGEAAFCGCARLTTVRVPAGVTVIEKDTFGASGLLQIALGNTVTEIREGAFAYCILNNIAFGPSVTQIGKNAFGVLRSFCYGGTAVQLMSTDIDPTNSALMSAQRYYHTHDDSLPTEQRNAVEATCTADGYSGDVVYCPCGALKARGAAIPALGHDYYAAAETAPTCTENGSIVYICRHDAGHTYTEVIPAAGHTFGAWRQTKAPTVDTEGEAQAVCTVCGAVQTIVLARLSRESRLTLNQTNVTLYYKDACALTASAPVVWSSSDESVVRVSDDGQLTAVGKGSAVVTAFCAETGETAACQVTVRYAWWQILLRIFLLGFLWY